MARNYPSENQLPMKPIDDNVREVAEMILTRIGKSKYEIAEIINDWEHSDDDQLTLYDAADLEAYEQMKL